MDRLKGGLSIVRIPIIGILLSTFFGLGALAQDAETNDSTSKAGTIKVKFRLDYKSDTERVSQKGTHKLIQDEELVFDLGKNELKLKKGVSISMCSS